MTSSGIRQALAAAEGGRRLTSFEAMALAECDDLATLAALAEQLCLAGHGTHVTFSKKVFIPLTKLCRDVCHYCTFAHTAPRGRAAYLSPEAVLDIARAGPGGRLQGGAVHAGRPAGTALLGCARRLARARGRDARSTISSGRPRWC